MHQFPYNVRVSSRYGAPMGRPDVGDSTEEYLVIRHRRVPMHGGDYDGGGAYWGGGWHVDPLFCFFTPDRSVVRYVRAKSYLFAQEIVREEFPQADFR